MTNGATLTAIVDVRPASDPTIQKRNWSRVLTSTRRIAVVIEPIRAVSAAPASASLTGVAPSRPSEPSEYTTTEATAAPAKANHT